MSLLTQKQVIDRYKKAVKVVTGEEAQVKSFSEIIKCNRIRAKKVLLGQRDLTLPEYMALTKEMEKLEKKAEITKKESASIKKNTKKIVNKIKSIRKTVKKTVKKPVKKTVKKPTRKTCSKKPIVKAA